MRRVALSSAVGGAFFMDAMPGRGEPLAQGIGRTGTLAVCVLIALGEPLEAAHRAIEAAGSSPMTPEQDDLVAWYASRSTKA